MIDCPACLRRSVLAISGLRPPPARLRLPSSQRLYHGKQPVDTATDETVTTVQAQRPAAFRYTLGGQAPDSPYLKSERHRQHRASLAAARSGKTVHAKQHDLEERRDAKLDKAIKEELRWFQDPLKLADHIRAALQKNDEDKALALVRAASKSMNCVVAWNHIIDHHMVHGKIKAAQKLYNEMKKRAQFPDAFTYTILLRGFADYAHVDTSVTSALSIYHSLFAPNSRVRPNIIHTNAALKVCARNNDMDALWGIAARIPNKGPGAADSNTFTIILDAMRHNAMLSGAKGDEDSGADEHYQNAVEHAHTLWTDVLHRWRQGDLRVDEGLVCAMGRLLLMSDRRSDWDDVFTLVEQTMDIPRFSPRLPSPSPGIPPLAPSTEARLESRDDARDSHYSIENHSMAPNRSGLYSYAPPGRNTLSLILTACVQLRFVQVARAYWKLLTDPEACAIVPDQDNKHVFLRILRITRNAKECVDFVRNQFTEKPALTKTYRIAMAGCLRAVAVARPNDDSAVIAANRLFEMMEERLGYIDIMTLKQYVDILDKYDSPLGKVRNVVYGVGLLLGDHAEETRRFKQYEELLLNASSQEEVAKIREILRTMIRVLYDIPRQPDGREKSALYKNFRDNLKSLLGKRGSAVEQPKGQPTLEEASEDIIDGNP